MTALAAPGSERRPTPAPLAVALLVGLLVGAAAEAKTPSVDVAAEATAREPLPRGYWTPAESRAVLDKTLVVRLAPDLSGLTPDERAAVDLLLEAGQAFQVIYEESLHRQARTALLDLERLDGRLGSPAATRDLLELYRLFQGPIATTLENQRVPFLPVAGIVPGKNVYPWGATKAQVEAAAAAAGAGAGTLLAPRTVVRAADLVTLTVDLATLRASPAIAVLHPGLRDRLLRLRAEARSRESGRAASAAFYAVPQSVAFAAGTRDAYASIAAAAGRLQASDPELARYLQLRARDLMTDDYFAGDVAWVTGRFGRLNAAIGAYETYDDELLGVKAFHGLSVLLRDAAESESLRAAIRGLQAIEDDLPYDRHKKVREDIPVGIYDVIADFGQARGTNTATILPNDPATARRFGRTILMRRNILTHPDLVAEHRRTWEAGLAAPHHADFRPEGDFYRTLWHEIGHYLGVDATRDGRELDAALQEHADHLEELKADLVSLHAARGLRAKGYYDDAKLRGVYSNGILRVLNKTKPRRDQAYQTMQLMQMNFFLEKGLLRYAAAAGKLEIDYARYHDVVGELLREVLALQDSGDKAAADRFIARLSVWEDVPHETLARQLRASEKGRFRLVRYAALGE